MTRLRQRARPLVVVLTTLGALACVPVSLGATYYVAPTGSDGASGLTPARAWRSLGQVNHSSFAPGDTVLFAGGATWAGSLSPRVSGTSTAPVTFGVYGAGRAVLDGTSGPGYAGIDAEGKSNLAFNGFEIRNWRGNAQAVYLNADHSIRFANIYAHDSQEGFHISYRSPTSGIAISGGTIANIGHGDPNGSGTAIIVPVGATGTTVTGTVIQNVADSCIIDTGTGSVYDSLTIRHCGYGLTAYGTHGVYMRGPGIVVRNSDISDARVDCVSVRFQGDVVERNNLHGCQIAIAWYEYATAPGTVRFVRNVISNAPVGIYIDGSATEHFVITNNTILGIGSGRSSFEGINVDTVGGVVPGVAIENNVFQGAVTPLIKVDATGSYVERANDLQTTVGFRGVWHGVNAHSLAAFAALTGQGAGDISADPRLASLDPNAPDAHPTASSPVIDGGVADTAAGTITPTCDGSDFSYCGRAPDMGAYEYGAPSRPPPGAGSPPPPPSPVAAPPGRPTGLKARRLSRRRAWLAWIPASGAVRYVVAIGSLQVWSGSHSSITIAVRASATAVSVIALDATGARSDPATVTVPRAARRSHRHRRGHRHGHRQPHHHPRPH